MKESAYIMEAKIVLIRHGITEGNEKRMYYGSTDVPLSVRGKQLLEKLAEEGIYPDSADAEYFTSGMLRTEQTFDIIYGDRKHEVIEELKELDFGVFERKTYEQLNGKAEYQEWVQAKDDSVPPPGGESIAEFNARIIKGFEELKVRNELLSLKLRNHMREALTVCICHGGVISGIMNYLWPDKYSHFYDWIPDPGYGYVITLKNGEVYGYRKI